jgi:hypothetical protein
MSNIYEQKAKKYKYKYLKLKNEYFGVGGVYGQTFEDTALLASRSPQGRYRKENNPVQPAPRLLRAPHAPGASGAQYAHAQIPGAQYAQMPGAQYAQIPRVPHAQGPSGAQYAQMPGAQYAHALEAPYAHALHEPHVQEAQYAQREQYAPRAPEAQYVHAQGAKYAHAHTLEAPYAPYTQNAQNAHTEHVEPNEIALIEAKKLYNELIILNPSLSEIQIKEIADDKYFEVLNYLRSGQKQTNSNYLRSGQKQTNSNDKFDGDDEICDTYVKTGFKQDNHAELYKEFVERNCLDKINNRYIKQQQ